MNKVTEGTNKYCGPAAFSIISGHSVDHCAAVIGDIIGKTADKVKGVYPQDLLKAFKRLRVEYEEVKLENHSIFALAHALSLNEPSLYLIEVPKHYVVIEVTKDYKIMICDNHTITPINLAGSARLNQKAQKIWKVRPKPAPELVEEQIIINKVDYIDSSRYNINILKCYKDPEDNYETVCGSFRATDSELKRVIEKLEQMVR